MSGIERRDGALHVEGLDGETLAERYGTPLFVYSRAAIENAWHGFAEALSERPHLICYSVKANSNLAVLDVLARLGSGFDIVSGGELKRVLAAGGLPERVVFSGVGKSLREIVAALEAGIRCFNVESAAELERLAVVAAAHGVVAPVSFRINPDVDAGTHPYISTGLKENKFGIGMEEAPTLYRRAASLESIDVQGIDCHIGSQLLDITPYRDALERMLALVDSLAEEGIALSHIDVGGGLGVRYRDETPLDVRDWARCVIDGIGERALEIQVEPGRSIVAQAGLMLTRVEYLKSNGDKHFAVVDAAMNDLLRPSLYDAWMGIEEVTTQGSGEGEGSAEEPFAGAASGKAGERRRTPGSGRERRVYDVVGPVCESADFLGKERELDIVEGELLAVRSAGAYASSMSSNYNTRPRAAEVLVDGERAHLVRAREETEALFAREFLLP